MELSAEDENAKFKQKYDPVMKKIAERGTLFDNEDIGMFFDLTMPGLDEIMAVITLADILKEHSYDLIVLDTAPIGHTIRLLALPAHMEKWVEVFDLMQSKHRFLFKSFTGKYRRDDADEFLEKMEGDVKRVNRLLKNQRSTRFIAVTIPEAVPVEKTEDLLKSLKEIGIPVRDIIVNQVRNSEDNCPYCAPIEEEQKKQVDYISKNFSGYNLRYVPSFPYPVRGVEHLKEYSQLLFGEELYQPVLSAKASPKPDNTSISINKPEEVSRLLEKKALMYIFGGKGGVGKTTVACATALTVAKRNPDKKVLIFSTDPAHSLSEIFNLPIGEEYAPVGNINNLFGMEMDALKLLNEWKEKNRDNIKEIFDEFSSGGVTIRFEEEIFKGLIDITPPGFDEIMALRKVVDYIAENMFDIYILDCAATGHLLRFLEMPEVARSWLKAMLKMFIKYKKIMKLSKQAEDFLELSQRVRKIQEILTDPGRCQFGVIGIPEPMGKEEMDRMVERLKKMKIACDQIMINLVLTPTQCNYCEPKRDEQQKLIQEIIMERSSKHQVFQIPAFPNPIKGIDQLTGLSRALYG
jgi:arsenite-transporting ATPase